VGKKERQRKLARDRMVRQQTRRAERARRTRQITMISVVCLVVVGLGVGGFFLFSQPGTTSNAAASATASPSGTAAATPTPSATPSATPALAAEPAKTCSYPTSGTAARNVGKPPAKPDWQASYQATIHTNRGDVVIDLLNSKATCTVNSFVYLASKKYFNNTNCHRLTTVSPLYVLQCGDPTGTGSGGPGYKFNDENLTGAKYTQGTVAMANGGPDTNGSQFFLVYKNSTLAASYTPFGTVVKGLGIIQNVAKAGSDNANGQGDGHPKKKVVIESVTIKKT
jgi:peptidyl-prolyl cis-trans isomerase B (cyclophilin B)